MKQNIGFSGFVDAFRDMNRDDNFTSDGKRALFDYLENFEEDTGSEYASAWDAMHEYRPDDMPTEGEEGDDLLEVQEKNEKAAHEWLEEHTTVIDVDGGGVIIQAF